MHKVSSVLSNNNSRYPVILSIENHCGVKQQRVMAEKFKVNQGSIL
jgi:hypothetical protein